MRSLKYILSVVSLLLFVGCMDTDIDQEKNVLDVENGAEFELYLTSPSKKNLSMSSRADASNELLIQRGYIFIFSQDESLIGFQKIESSDVVKNGTQYPTITTDISGYNASKDKVIAVFNYCESSVVDEGNFVGLTKENISDYFPLDKAYLGKLQSDFTSGSYNLGMPMFVNDFDDDDSDLVHKVYRALARIELYVEDSDVSTSLVGHSHKFTTENVKFTVVNMAENGEIGYDSRSDIKGKIGGSVHPNSDDITFDYVPSKYQPGQDISATTPSKNTIYLYEFPYSTKVITGDGLTQGVYDPDRISILIEHEDQAAHPDVTFYYKLQLVDKSTNDYYDIERNHDYKVVIKDVYSDGYLDVEEAYMMPPSNIEYEIFDDQGDLTFSNGQYAISMDEVLNYESITIYGPATTPISFDNIRRILPSEVTDPLTDEELAEMTNIVDFAVVSEDGVTVDVVQNDFSGDGRLTDEGRSIKLELSGDGSCTIRLKIRLGNLEMGFNSIIIHKVGSEFGGDSSFDAHPCQLRIENKKFIENTWNSVHSDFGIRNDGDDMIVYMGENATPVGYKTLNGYISSAAAANAYPYFEPKTREGFYSYYDLEEDPDTTTVRKTKIVLNQLAPFYVGHYGSKAESGPHYYDALIVEKIEEIKDTHSYPNKETGGLKPWSEQLGKIYYEKDKIYGSYLGLDKYLNFAEGLTIANHIVTQNTTDKSLPTAARYCYMKNDIDGDGEIESNEPVVWFLPAANQALAMWVSKHLIDSEVDAKYFGFNLQHDNTPWYWTCSEVAPTDWDLQNLTFENNVARFNMLEGELSVGGRKGENGYDDLAHIRCVRVIRYDNSK